MGPLQQTGPVGKPSPSQPVKPGDNEQGQSFKDVLLDSLDEVNALQKEASQGVEKVLTGETDNLAEVFSAVRKSEVAFNMMMEMRNKLVEAYQEVQQMRV
jgi:flagellar hook-basal body complex protein FliE